MKILIILAIILLSAFSAISTTSEKNVMGLASNYFGVQNIDSVAYGYASNNGHTLIQSAVITC